MTTSTPGSGSIAVNTINLAGAPAPGKWVLTDATKVYGWDVRKGNATSGATVVPTGDELVVATFRVEIWTAPDRLLFQAFRKQFLGKPAAAVPGSTVNFALGISHPELAALGVDTVVVKEISPLIWDEGSDRWVATVKFLQYRKPVPAPSPPLATIPALATPTPTAQDALDASNAAKYVQISKLSGAQ